MAELCPQFLGDVRRQRRDQLHDRVGNVGGTTTQLGQMVVALDQLGDGGVEAQMVEFFAHRCNRAVHDTHRLVVGRSGQHSQRARVFVDDIAPQAL